MEPDNQRDLELKIFNQLVAQVRRDENNPGRSGDIISPFAKVLYVWLAFHEMFQKEKAAGGFTFRRIIPRCPVDSRGVIREPGQENVEDIRCVVDFFIETVGFYFDPDKTLKICVLIDGLEFQEKPPRWIREEEEKEEFLKKNGYVVIRFKGSEIFRDPAKAIYRIEEIYWGSENEELKRRKKSK